MGWLMRFAGKVGAQRLFALVHKVLGYGCPDQAGNLLWQSGAEQPQKSRLRDQYDRIEAFAGAPLIQLSGDAMGELDGFVLVCGPLAASPVMADSSPPTSGRSSVVENSSRPVGSEFLITEPASSVRQRVDEMHLGPRIVSLIESSLGVVGDDNSRSHAAPLLTYCS
jgi:hypothetical protein